LLVIVVYDYHDQYEYYYNNMIVRYSVTESQSEFLF